MKKLLSSAVLLIAAGGAIAASDAVFERMPADAYTDMLRSAGAAYERKQYTKAFELNQRAACAGDKTSQAILGRMYVLGQGVARDEVAGYAWIKLAAEFNFPDFSTLAHKLEAAMTPEQRAQGNAKSDALRKDYGLGATNIGCRGEAKRSLYVIDAVVCTPQSGGGGTVLLHRCGEDAAK